MSFHEPVLVREVVSGLVVDPGGTYVDATAGGGGHGQAILEALKTGASYGSTGPAIHDIQIDTCGDVAVATVKCSEAQRIYGVCSRTGVQYYDPAGTFEEATFALKAGAEWVRFEVVSPDGSKAWSNPFDLTE